MAYDIPSQEGSYAQDDEASDYGETPAGDGNFANLKVGDGTGS